jgi:two-component system response regulator BaeR
MHFDKNKSILYHEGKSIRLSGQKGRLVEYLSDNPGFIRNRYQIMDVTHGVNATVEDRTIDTLVKRVRDLCKKTLGVNPIETIYDFGYSWKENI